MTIDPRDITGFTIRATDDPEAQEAAELVLEGFHRMRLVLIKKGYSPEEAILWTYQYFLDYSREHGIEPIPATDL
ncbi:MAG: hypothetical protein ACREQ5_06860 [Candidatus Dormibacteria bacterium]